MMKWVLSFIVVAAMVACAWQQPVTRTQCFEQSVCAALALQTRAHKVSRVVVGENAQGQLHAEAQYLEGEQWVPVVMDIDGVYKINKSTVVKITHIMQNDGVKVIGMLAGPVEDVE